MFTLYWILYRLLTARYVFGQSGGVLVKEFYNTSRESSNTISGFKIYVRQYSVGSGTVIRYTMSATGSYNVQGYIKGVAIFL